MNRRLSAILAAMSLSAVLMTAGCKSKPAPATGVTNADGSITNPDGSVTYPAGTKPPTVTVTKNPDGSITNADGSVTYPAGVTPPSSATPTQTPAPAAQSAASTPPPPPAAKALRVPSGTRVAVSLSETLSASKNNAGDRFGGELAEAIKTPSGAVLYPRGTRVEGTVAAAKGRGRFKGSGDLAIELTSIGGQSVSTNEYEKVQSGKGKRTAGLVGGGTGLGAIIGGLAGGGKGALIGGLAGAGAGTAGAAYTGNKDVVIPAETVVTFTLAAPLSK